VRYLTEFNYCPKCGEELVDGAEFCHSCGTELTEGGNNNQSRDGSEESDVISGIEADPDITMDDLDLDNRSSQGYNELEERVEQVIDEQGYTIEDISGEQVVKALIADKIIERSARIKVEEQIE
jgi:uncharacterized Zn finger protein (UPF0148 family)